LERLALKFLVVNDDGIYAEGLWALAGALTPLGEVVVVAPDRQQSGTGPAITLHHPLRVTEIGAPVARVRAYSVDGTPGDCVILGLETLAGDGVEQVVCGINEGANLGDDVLISGTVGAALQGYFRGLPSMAVSVAGTAPRFDAAARIAALMAGQIAAGALPGRILLNINVPNLFMEEVKGVEVTRLGRRSYADTISEGDDGQRKYYWIVRGTARWSEEEGTDIWAIMRDRVSITPLYTDLTSRSQLASLEGLCPALFGGLCLRG